MTFDTDFDSDSRALLCRRYSRGQLSLTPTLEMLKEVRPRKIPWLGNRILDFEA